MFGVEVIDAVARFEDYRLNMPINLKVGFGENLAIVGPNGAGKSLLVDHLLGNIALKSGSVTCKDGDQVAPSSIVKFMSFRDIYSMADCKNMYYQQRWNATEVDESPLVSTLLNGHSDSEIEYYCNLFQISDLLPKRLISLSSGELRKFLVARVLLTHPKILVLDNLFIGLDETSRNLLSTMLCDLSKQDLLKVVLILSNPNDVPEWIDKVLPMHNKLCLDIMSRTDFAEAKSLHDELFSVSEKVELPSVASEPITLDYDTAVDMINVNVKYPTRHILKNVNWQVKRGEHWALLGENGCGKSTLLSLVCGDNPQSYANTITLFDRKRGSGESIWEIKKNIGYLSPDMHTFYQENIPCLDVVASGYFDTIGLYKRPDDTQRANAMHWMEAFGAAHLAKRSFVKISYGEQRLILLTRVFVKNPNLLILDEPLHGLDYGKKRLAKRIIEVYCSQPNRTLIYVTHYRNEIPSCVTKEKVLVKNI